VPSTAVGEGDEVGEGDAAGAEGDEPGAAVEAGGDPVETGGDPVAPGGVVEAGGALPDADAVWVGAPDGGAEGEVAATSVGEAVGDLVMTTALGDAVTAGLTEGVGLAWPGAGPRATGRGCAARTAAPSAMSPRTAMSGTSATRLPSGRSSRQLGQKPETGIVT